MNLAILLTSHSRKEVTLACLEALQDNAKSTSVVLHVVLVDDGSTDGTADSVRERFPEVEIIHGDGSLYWNKGMHCAFARALELGFDAYLWLNDDTILCPGAIERLIASWRLIRDRTNADAIVVGTTRDPDSGRASYGGVLRCSAFKRFRYNLVEPGNDLIQCDTMNGNCVLIPHSVAERVGNLDPVFAHAMGDTDYGLRATRAGFGVWVAPFYVGWCRKNTPAGTFADHTLPMRQRWKSMKSKKGLPARSWLHFTRRHGGLLWPLYFAWPYARLLTSGLAHNIGKRNALPHR